MSLVSFWISFVLGSCPVRSVKDLFETYLNKLLAIGVPKCVNTMGNITIYWCIS